MRPVLFVIFGAALAAAGCCALDEGELTKLRDEATAIQKDRKSVV